MSFTQKSSGHIAIQKEGCCFCCCCYLGGLNTIQEVDDCFCWAIQKENNYVRSSDSWVNIDKNRLANLIAKHYNRTRRSGTITTNRKRSHFWVEDNGKEVYNSVRPEFGH